MRVTVFTMSYEDQWATKIACCGILQTIMDVIPDLSSVPGPITIKFSASEGTIFRPRLFACSNVSIGIKRIDRADLPSGLTRQQWVELIALDLRMLLQVAGFKCDHKVIEVNEDGAFDLIFSPR